MRHCLVQRVPLSRLSAFSLWPALRMGRHAILHVADSTVSSHWTTPPCCPPHQFPDAGRGLVAAGPISYGETILTERPLLCYQSNELEGKVGGGACGVSVYAYLPCRVS